MNRSFLILKEEDLALQWSIMFVYFWPIYQLKIVNVDVRIKLLYNQNDGFHIDYSSLSVACSRLKLGIVTTCLLHLWPPTRTDFLMSQLLRAEAKLPIIIVFMNLSLTILVEFVHLAYKIGFHPVFSMPEAICFRHLTKREKLFRSFDWSHPWEPLTFCVWCGGGSNELERLYQDDYSLDSILHNYDFITTRY